MATLQDIFDKALGIAEEIAGQSIQIDEALVELMYPYVLRNVILSLKDSAKLDQLRVTGAITFTDGVGDLPAGVLTEFLCTSALSGDSAVTGISYLNHPEDLATQLYTQFGYFAVKGDKLLYQAGQDQATFDGDLDFTSVQMPATPPDLVTELVLPFGILEEVEIELARAIRGEPPYFELGLESDIK